MKDKKRRISLILKSTIGVILIAMLFSVTLTVLSYYYYKSKSFAYYENKTTDLAKTAALLVDGDKIGTYLETGQTDEYYNSLMKLLSDVRAENSDVKYLYIQYLDLEKKESVYILDTDTEDPVPLGTRLPFSEANRDSALSNILLNPFISDEPDYGWLCSTIAPVYRSDGTLAAGVGVDISMEHVREQMNSLLLKNVMYATIVAAVMVLLAVYSIYKRIVKPITSLSNAASCYDSGMLLEDFSSELSRIQNPTGDEIEELTVSVQKMETDIKHYVRDLTSATAANERISAELNIATNIQAAMLPSIFPAFPDRDDFDLYATMHPAKEVGGDFYDYFLLDYDHLAVIAADVSGKGVPAALFMVIAKTLIRNQALFGLPPEKVFSKVNMQLCENNKGKMFVTAWMGILELSTGKVIYANAGHTRPVIARSSGNCEYLKGRANFVLAGMPMMQYTQGELQLNPGDTLFLYTDGVTEATDANEELFGEARLLETISAHPTDKPQDMIAAVKDAIDGFVKEAPQFDDITMLAVQYKGEESGVYTETKTFIAAKKELNAVLEWLEKLLEAHDCPMKVQTQLNIAVEEIFVNIASYAYPQGTSTADITCHFSGSSPTNLEITFADKGVPYDPLKKKDPNTKLGADERQIGGLGIYMVKQSMDNVRYKYENGQNVLTITKSWE